MLTFAGGSAGSGVVRRLDAVGEVDTGNLAFSETSLRPFGFEGSLLGPDYSRINLNGHVVPPVRLRRAGNFTMIQGDPGVSPRRRVNVAYRNPSTAIRRISLRSH